VVLIGCLPWTLLLVCVGRFLTERSAAVRRLRTPAMGFFLLWAGWCVLFFSASSSKLATYLLPAAPAVALLVGCYLDRVLFQPAVTGWLRRVGGAVPRLTVLGLVLTWVVVSIGAWRRELLGPVAMTLHVAVSLGCLAVVTVGWRRLSEKASWL